MRQRAEFGALVLRAMRLHREWGSVRIELGRLWLIRCARHPSGRRTLDHPNAWMTCWRRKLPEWDPATKWQGSEEPGPYWRGCDSRLKDKDDYGHFARCLFPDCECRKGRSASRRFCKRTKERNHDQR